MKASIEKIFNFFQFFKRQNQAIFSFSCNNFAKESWAKKNFWGQPLCQFSSQNLGKWKFHNKLFRELLPHIQKSVSWGKVDDYTRTLSGSDLHIMYHHVFEVSDYVLSISLLKKKKLFLDPKMLVQLLTSHEIDVKK